MTGMDSVLPHGTTVSAFASLSMDPPMVLVALDRHSALLAVLRRTRRFGVNVLGNGQAALASRFARKGGAAKFAGTPWRTHAGVPRIPGAGVFLGRTVADLVLGDVCHAESSGGAPLTYHRRTFGTHTRTGEVVSR
ncbi:flavin reductase (DIM6/NTAB) family NADH-FMN oxidoreductase RutF [Saccharomonospora amisosensis]|uniref:Flavin reductase (DIM6/NTAB) family NADH-FMN oxidoreductase RutF n=1 Tax=Saccharomonospora amisosensis TaxID=1128677 RepID=A0A7X5UP05_9PSEU|nr:flavin reductase (DIM6/NTAB) family NADH-FMN oxidoreductase RutF [Saccharomonospora amisosensis]